MTPKAWNRTQRDAGRANLRILESDCNNAGFTSMAKRASALLQGRPRAGV
jgi:hypothetical protein